MTVLSRYFITPVFWSAVVRSRRHRIRIERMIAPHLDRGHGDLRARRRSRSFSSDSTDSFSYSSATRSWNGFVRQYGCGGVPPAGAVDSKM